MLKRRSRVGKTLGWRKKKVGNAWMSGKVYIRAFPYVLGIGIYKTSSLLASFFFLLGTVSPHYWAIVTHGTLCTTLYSKNSLLLDQKTHLFKNRTHNRPMRPCSNSPLASKKNLFFIFFFPFFFFHYCIHSSKNSCSFFHNSWSIPRCPFLYLRTEEKKKTRRKKKLKKTTCQSSKTSNN